MKFQAKKLLKERKLIIESTFLVSKSHEKKQLTKKSGVKICKERLLNTLFFIVW